MLLCDADAVLAVAVAQPAMAVLARYAARFSVRAHDVTVDATLLWVGGGLALAVAVFLAGNEPPPARLRDHADRPLVRAGRGRVDAHHHALRATEAADGIPRQRAGHQRPVVSFERKRAEISAFYKEAIRRISLIPGVDRVALGTVVPWRDQGFFAAQFTADGYKRANGDEDPRARFRTVSGDSSKRSECG